MAVSRSSSACSVPQVWHVSSCNPNSFSYKWTIQDPVPLISSYTVRKPFVTPSFKTQIQLKRNGTINTPYWQLSLKSRNTDTQYYSVDEPYKDFMVAFGFELKDGIKSLTKGRYTGVWVITKVKVLTKQLDPSSLKRRSAVCIVPAIKKEDKAEELLYQTPLYKDIFPLDALSMNVIDNKLTLEVTVTTYEFDSPTTIYYAPTPKSWELQSDDLNIDLNMVMNESRKNGEFTDVIIIAKDKEFTAHKSVLAAQSEFFKTKFQRWERDDKVDMSEVGSDAMEVILSFLYTRNTEFLTKDKLHIEILQCAEKYQIKALFDSIMRHISEKFTASNVIEILLTADAHDMTQLKKACLLNIVKNFSKVVKTEEWKRLEDSTEQVGLYKEVMKEVTQLLSCKE